MKNIMLTDISEDIYFFILTSTFDLGIQLKIVALIYILFNKLDFPCCSKQGSSEDFIYKINMTLTFET